MPIPLNKSHTAEIGRAFGEVLRTFAARGWDRYGAATEQEAYERWLVVDAVARELLARIDVHPALLPVLAVRISPPLLDLARFQPADEPLTPRD